MAAAGKIVQLRKIAKLYVGAATPGEKNAAAAAFRRRKIGTPYVSYSIDEFLALGDTVPLNPWPRRRTWTRPTPTPEQREANRLAAERREREFAERRERAKRWQQEFQAAVERAAAELEQRIAAERARRERWRRPRDARGRFCRNPPPESP